MRNASTGFYYLEIVIALLLGQWIVSGVLLAEVNIMRTTANADYQSIAVNVGEMVAERMSLESGELSSQFLTDIKQYTNHNLPSGSVDFLQNNNLLTVAIYWNGFNRETCARIKNGESGCYRVALVINQKNQA